MPNLQVGGQVVQFIANRVFPIASPVVVGRIGDQIRRSVRSFAEANQGPMIKFAKGDRKIDKMKPYLAPAGTTRPIRTRADRELRRSGGRRSSSRRACTITEARHGGAPHFGWDRADRRVICCYFYLRDEEFGPAFAKISAYFPYRSMCG